MKFKRFKLSHTLIAGVSFGLLVCLLIASVAVYHQYKTLSLANKIYSHPLIVIDAARDIRLYARNIFETSKKCADGLVECSDNVIEKIREQEKTIDSKLPIIEAQYTGQASDVARLKDDILSQKRYTDAVILLVQKSNCKAANEYLVQNKYDEFYAKFYSDVDTILNVSRSKASEFLQEAKDNATSSFIQLMTISLIGLSLGVLFVITAIRYIKKEFGELEVYATDIQNEKFRDIIFLDSDSDEFTQLKAAMNSMSQSLSRANMQKERALKEIQSQAIELFHQKHELEEARLRYKTIFEQSIIAIVLIDPETKKFLEFNEAACNMFGYSPSELIKIKITNIENYDISNFSDERIEYIAQNGFDEFETIFRKKDATLCNVQVVIKLIELHGKSFLQLSIRDVTLRKKFYLELLEEKNRFKELFDSSPVALAILNSSLEIVELNPAFSAYVGYNLSEVPNLKVLTQIAFADEDYRTYVINATKISLLEANDRHGRFVTPTFKIKCKDEQIKYTQVSGAILGNGYIVAFSDLTESVTYEKSLRGLNEKLALRVEEETKKRLASEQVLIQNEKMAQLGNMIGIILHQWKQPLSAISLFAQELMVACKFNDIDLKLIQSNALNIMSQIDFMTKTADEFQDFYKPSKEKRNFFVKNQIEIIGSILTKQLSLAGIEFSVTGDDTLIAHGFDSEFKQVILNIISNAKDALKEANIQNPYINVDIFKLNTNVVIQIQDNAGGISDELLPDKLFEPFVSTKNEHGTGIGLSLCKTIITERFNGTLAASNSELGAVFTISIPC